MKITDNSKVNYEAEADVLSWELSSQKIDYAKEVGNFVVHFSKNNLPVLIEILEATQFLRKAKNLVEAPRGLKVRQASLAGT